METEIAKLPSVVWMKPRLRAGLPSGEGASNDGAVTSGQTEEVLRASREAGGAMPVDIEPGARESNPERQPGDEAEGRKVRGSALHDSVGCHECRIGIRRLLIV